jgi:PIN domain nuclease of toxin-antitoxin system
MEERIPKPAWKLLDTEMPCVSPIVELELTYLYEVGRVKKPASAPLDELRRRIGLEVAEVPASELVHAAMGLSWTRDPFDRLIAAHAIVADAPLITADRTMLKHLPQATWD